MAYKPPIHGRDHCPGGADPIPCMGYPYVFRKHDSGQTIGPGNVEDIVWDDTDFSQAGSYFQPDDSISFNIVGPGVFDFLGAVVFASDFNSKTMLQVNCNAFGNFPMSLGWGGFYSDGGVLLASSPATIIHFQARIPSGMSATALTVSQGNAAGKDLFEATFRVARIGSYELGTGIGSEADLTFL